MSAAGTRMIAFYLPQYHPIPENDEWWETGFTEWTNVTKAKPLYPGHYQPQLPADLGFYDLRVPETRTDQAKLAARYGIEGFCYWHYWFAGRRLLERPFNDVLSSGQPDFPFCLAWANQTWSGIWHGNPNKVLVEQTYPGVQDYENHFYVLLPAFRDRRYMTVGGKRLFVVYNIREFPEPRKFLDTWRGLAQKEGLGGFYFVGVKDAPWSKEPQGFDAFTNNFTIQPLTRPQPEIEKRMRKLWSRLTNTPAVYSYESFIKTIFPESAKKENFLPCVVPNWDNTPRSGIRGVVLSGSTPELFKKHLRDAMAMVERKPVQERIVFVKSWNEWAEGNFLEPDRKWGHAYLQAVKDGLESR